MLSLAAVMKIKYTHFGTLDVQGTRGYYLTMIRSFKDKRTQRVFEGEPVREFQAVYRQAERRLRVLDVAETLESLMMLPGNRFKALGGDRQGQYSIRVNDQWRICFEWHEDRPCQVEIVDYH